MSPDRPSTDVRAWVAPVVGSGVALAGLVWSAASPLMRLPGGAFRSEVVVVWSACAGLALISWCWRSAARGAVWWAVVAMLGHAAALQLVAAGRVVGYQHYRPLEALANGSGWLWIAVLVGQAALVTWRLASLAVRGALRPRRLISVGRWSLLLVASLLLGATVSREPGTYLAELAVAVAVHGLAAGTVVAAACALPGPDHTARHRWAARWQRIAGWLPLAGAVWVTGVAAVLALVVYQAHPHVPDEVVYLYQARYFAAGMATMPAPPVPDAFDVNLMTIAGGRWNGLFPPGWPAVLALGVVLGVPWLVNPVLAGVGVLLASSVVTRLYGRSTARLTTVLLCVSPWYVFLGMSFMSHTATLVALLVGADALLRLRDTGSVRWAAVAGVAVGAVSLIRPLDGVVAAALIGLGLLAVNRPRLRPSRLVAFAGALLLVGGLQLGYNAAVTGDPLLLPLDENLDQRYGAGTNALGFGPDRGWGWDGLDPLPGHGPLDVVINANLNLTVIDVELLGWATGSLLAALVFLLAGTNRAPDRWMLGALGAVFLAYALYWFSGGPDFGARYWFLMIVPLVVLTARGIELAAAKLDGVRVAGAVIILCLTALVAFIPWRAVDKYYHYRGMQPGIRYLVRAGTVGSGLVLIQGRRHPDYASAAMYNPLDLTSEAPVFVWDRSPEVRRAVLEAFPDRDVWVVEGPTRTGAGYEVVAGPLEARAVLEETLP